MEEVTERHCEPHIACWLDQSFWLVIIRSATTKKCWVDLTLLNHMKMMKLLRASNI